jgi:hypothetical protein
MKISFRQEVIDAFYTIISRNEHVYIDGNNYPFCIVHNL